ncbi:ankyrin repeat protein [Pandoravirus inopinatum]|uniref:Ankyrin repeat protein n=1 Tax=Pandoravirus inopinatum TaxID=1605721 RepID=A0A0B5J6B9_9VIRU|nr:ankyrin repeat protein [Pandoravirus inopinatum]AJF97290.1 ankyrin repeat protein [Pandoravirus inopinatum]
MTIGHLPDEVLAHILKWLPCADRATAASVDRRWRSLCEDAHLLGRPLCVGPFAAQSGSEPFGALAHNRQVCDTYIHARDCPCHDNRLVDAAKHGRHDLVKPLLQGWAPRYNVACLVAAARGDDNVLMALARDRGFHTFPAVEVAEVAARAGHIHVLDHVVDFARYVVPSLCRNAAGAGQLETLVHLRQRGARWDKETFEAAADSGHLGVFQYLYENGCPREDWVVTCRLAAKGHAHLVDYALEHGLEWSSQADYAAALGNHLDVLLVARTRGRPWTAKACSGAAAGGHLDLLKRVRADGCPWSGQTCMDAARNGHLDILTYAIENGCPMGEYAAKAACKKGHLDCLVYAHQHGAPLEDNDCWVAARKGHVDCMEYVHAQGLCGGECRKYFPPPKARAVSLSFPFPLGAHISALIFFFFVFGFVFKQKR